MDIRFYICDIDEWACDAVSGDRRVVVWSQQLVPLGYTVADLRLRDRGIVGRNENKMLGRFQTEEEAFDFIENYDVGPGNNKIIVP